MAVKFNKEMLLKHRFWIMLGATVLLALGGIFYLELFVDADTKRNELITALKSGVPKSIPPANENVVKAYSAITEANQKKETEIWRAAYKAQESLFRWPDAVEKKYNFANGYFATEIKVLKAPDGKTPWPADKTTDTDVVKTIHGTLVEQLPHGFILQARDPKEDPKEAKDTKGAKGTKEPKGTKEAKLVKILITPTDGVKVTEDGKPILFGKLFEQFQRPGKLLAVTYQQGRYFNDVLTADEVGDFGDSYKSQVHDILTIVEPLDEKLNGVVQLKDWLYKPAPDYPDPAQKFIRFMPGAWATEKGGANSREAWIAQENLWVQKEIYNRIKAANDDLSTFKGNGGNEKKAYTFKNPNFELALFLDEKGTLSFKMKNLLDRQQSIDLSFRVWLNDAANFKPETIRISGDPLKPAGDKGAVSKAFVFPIEKSPRNAVLKVQQVLTWQTAAVKRIDQISIGSNGGFEEQSHSHRTFGEEALPLSGLPLRPFDKKELEAPPVEVKGSVPIKAPPNKGPRPKFGPPMAAVGGNVGQLLYPDFWLFRYSDVNERFRRIPVAVVLIVDQGHVDRVLTSFNNSKLRFLPTQVLLNQYPGSLQPPAPLATEEGPAVPRFPSFPGGPRPNPMATAQTQPSGTSDTEANMELVIYGFMTLYQRYPTAPPPVAPPVAPPVTPPAKTP